MTYYVVWVALFVLGASAVAAGFWAYFVAPYHPGAKDLSIWTPLFCGVGFAVLCILGVAALVAWTMAGVD